jgi:hypothetical protein
MTTSGPDGGRAWWEDQPVPDDQTNPDSSRVGPVPISLSPAVTMPEPGDIRVLMDKQAITESLYRYCRAMDRQDHALASSLWHPGGTADYGEEVFVGTGQGFVDWSMVMHSRLSAQSHQVINILIDVEGEQAVSESYTSTTAVGPIDSDGQVTIRDVRGRFLDEWSRRQGFWALSHRQSVNDVTVVSTVPASQVPLGLIARPDINDPSYLLFASLGR